MLVVGITSMSVVAYCGCCAIAAIPAGIVWVYMHARVPRAGTSLIMALVFAVVIFVIGSGWPVALGLAVGGASPSWRGKRSGTGGSQASPWGTRFSRPAGRRAFSFPCSPPRTTTAS